MVYKLAVLISHPIQYAVPLYKRLAQHPNIELTVYFCSRQGVIEYVDPGFGKPIRWDIPLLDGYRHHFLRNYSPARLVGSPLSLINPGIFREILSTSYDAVWIQGWTYFTTWLAIVAAAISKTPVLYRSEASLQYDMHIARSWFVKMLKPPLLRYLFNKRFSGFLGIGSANKEFYTHYGVPDEKMFLVPYAVDNDYFKSRSSEYRIERNDLRQRLGFNVDDVVFLFAGKMTSQKQPLMALESYRRIYGPGCALLMLGDGALLEEAKRFATQYALKKVRFLGFVNQAEMPKYYAASDVLIRPDSWYQGDWGLTINEAAASGLAMIVTDAHAAAIDLVQQGRNGFVVPTGDSAEFARAMAAMIADPASCRRMGQESMRMIGSWSYHEGVEGIIHALAYTSKQQR